MPTLQPHPIDAMASFGGIRYNLDPGTLLFTTSDHATVWDLYSRYLDDLAPLTSEMAGHRKALTDAGYSCDFSDRESELLYLLVRALQPATVVEISPCHGYSTNYILAALTHNGKGELHSYEIVEQIHGKPTEKAIRDNQLSWLDQTRLHIHIGDATQADIPDPDFLFLDSAHEAWFASWYFQSIVPRAKVCLVHDIVIDQPTRRTLVPKGPFMGVRESVHVLQTLNLNGQKALSVAEFARHFRDSNLAPRLAARYPGAPERSVIFSGHEQAPAATQIHLALSQLRKWQHRVVDGDRGVMREIQSFLDADMPLYGRLAAGLLFPLAGYREHAMQTEFRHYFDVLIRGVDTQLESVSDLVAALELGAQLGSPTLVSSALASGLRHLPVPIVRFYARHYREFGVPFNRYVARFAGTASRAKQWLGM